MIDKTVINVNIVEDITEVAIVKDVKDATEVITENITDRNEVITVEAITKESLTLMYNSGYMCNFDKSEAITDANKANKVIEAVKALVNPRRLRGPVDQLKLKSIVKQPATEIKHTDGSDLLKNETVVYNEIEAPPDMLCSVPGSNAQIKAYHTRAHSTAAGSTSSTSNDIETAGAYVQLEQNLFSVCSVSSTRSAGDYVQRESSLLMNQAQSFNFIGKSESKCKVINKKIELNRNLLDTEPSKILSRSRKTESTDSRPKPPYAICLQKMFPA